MAITSSKISIYTDSHLTNLVKIVNGTTSPLQTITISNLSEHTNYWAIAEATNSSSLIGTSAVYQFQTLWSEPILDIKATNITKNSATLTFSYTGNYPADFTSYTDLTATYNVKNDLSTLTTLQFRDLANGTPETINLSGLTQGTTYVVEFVLDPFYNGEVTAQIEFTTLSDGQPVVVINSVSNITDDSADASISIS